MIWLIIGIVGMLAFLALLVIIPVWAGMGTLVESLIITAIALTVTAGVFLFALALSHGAVQVFG